MIDARATGKRIGLWAAFAAALALNAAWYFTVRQNDAVVRALPPPPSVDTVRIASLSEPVAAAKAVMLWLQAFDNQPGISIPFSRLDYQTLVTWLKTVRELDPRSQYPLLAASRIYTAVNDEEKLRTIMDYVFTEFYKDPAAHWPWLAQVAVLAKHRLQDQTLALKYARALADTRRDIDIPAWARQLELVLLEEQGELETLRVLIGGLLISGKITDAQEQRYLELMLHRMDTSQQQSTNQTK